MKPPVCAVCNREFDPAEEGGTVSFQRPDDPRSGDHLDPAEVRRRGPPTGHPPHVEWLCGDHHAAAGALTHLTKAEALERIRSAPSDQRP